MAKQFYFRGKTMEELRALGVEEFARLCNSRARRTLLRRGVDKHLLKKINNALKIKEAGKQPKPIKTHLRNTIVIPVMVGLTFGIYKGNEFVFAEIKKEMLGHYFGELALTRKRLVHGKAGIGATRSSTAISARG